MITKHVARTDVSAGNDVAQTITIHIANGAGKICRGMTSIEVGPLGFDPKTRRFALVGKVYEQLGPGRYPIIPAALIIYPAILSSKGLENAPFATGRCRAAQWIVWRWTGIAALGVGAAQAAASSARPVIRRVRVTAAPIADRPYRATVLTSTVLRSKSAKPPRVDGIAPWLGRALSAPGQPLPGKCASVIFPPQLVKQFGHHELAARLNDHS